MSMLANLKLVTSKREQGTNPVLHRRNKLSIKINDQILLAEAKRDGRTYAPTRLKTSTNQVTGERQTFESAKMIREWWYIPDGQFKFPHPWPPQIPPGSAVRL